MATEPEAAADATPTNDAVPVDVGNAAPAAGNGAANPAATGAEGTERTGPWGDDWREKVANGDDKTLKKLQRYISPAAFVDGHMNLSDKMSKGEAAAAPTLSDNPTEAEVAVFREARGIPSEPDGYLSNLADGMVIGDDDKPILDEYLKSVHGANATQEEVNRSLNWYFTERTARRDAVVEEDQRFAQSSEDAMRDEWGNEFRVNENRIEALIETMPGDLAQRFSQARLGGDENGLGAPARHDPDMRRWLAHVANEINPAGTVVAGSTGNQVQSIDTRLSEIRDMRRTNRTAYYKNDSVLQEERELIDAKSKLEKRSAA